MTFINFFQTFFPSPIVVWTLKGRSGGGDGDDDNEGGGGDGNGGEGGDGELSIEPSMKQLIDEVSSVNQSVNQSINRFIDNALIDRAMH